MKKVLTMMTCLLLVLGLAACGGQESSAPSDSGSANETAPAELAPAADETPAQSVSDAAKAAAGKTLVVYYSATNNTEAVAGYVAEAMGADLFELIPTQPYTDADLNWRDRESRVSREHDDESLRAVALENAVPDNWDAYDTVFVGYPIWWGIAAWPVNEFISANDFTGKTVIPFCTSTSSGLGESGELLAAAAETGNWLEGQRFQSRASQDEVASWAESLGF